MNKNLENIEDLIDIMEISEEIKNFENEDIKLLYSLAKDLIETRNRCRESIIYRLAMTLYHSGRYWGNHVIEILDDPTNIYLKLSSNTKFQEQYHSIWLKIKEKKDRLIKANFTMTLTCFLLATYLYYSQGGS